MARRTAEVVIDKDGRDKGKTFLLTEMDAYRAEDWALRAFGAMTRAGVEIPEGIFDLGMPGVAVVGMGSFLKAPYAELKPLFEEMFACVQIVEPAITRATTPDDIEEVQTRVTLRDEVIRLHTGFTLAGVLSVALATVLASAGLSLSDTPTSQQELDLSSPNGSPP